MKKNLGDMFFLLIGAFLLSLGINCFLVPVKISVGGISGIATILLYFAKIPLSLTTFLLNLILLFFGWRVLSLGAVLKSLLGVALLSLFLQVTSSLFVYKEDILIAAIFGGILVGAGAALPLRRGFATGGSDFAALMLHQKYPHITPNGFVLILDAVVILASGIAFQNITVMFYSILSLYASNRMMDLILVHGDFAKSVTIITSKSKEISSRIMTELSRGVTAIYSRGCYKNIDGEMLFCVVREREVPKLIDIVRSMDAGAFAVITQVRQVRGEGFKQM